MFLASSGLRKGEVLGLKKSNLDTKLRAIIPSCHAGETKHSGITFYNAEAEAYLNEYLAQLDSKTERLFVIGPEHFLKAWRHARKKSGINLKPKDLRDFLSQELGKALITDSFIDIFQGRSPRNVLAKHYIPPRIKTAARDL